MSHEISVDRPRSSSTRMSTAAGLASRAVKLRTAYVLGTGIATASAAAIVQAPGVEKPTAGPTRQAWPAAAFATRPEIAAGPSWGADRPGTPEGPGLPVAPLAPGGPLGPRAPLG